MPRWFYLLVARKFGVKSLVRISALGVLWWLLVMAAVVFTVVYPTIKSTPGGWSSAAVWGTALLVGWPTAIAAVFLKFSDPLKKTWVVSRKHRKYRKSRKSSAALAIADLERLLNSGAPPAEAEMREVRQRLLVAAAGSIGELLNFEDHEDIVASLIDFSALKVDHMRVVARSVTDRPLGDKAEYPRFDLVGNEAIKKNTCVVVDDVKKDSRYGHIGERAYRTVAAIPVVKFGRAYAAISLDSPIPFRFWGRGADLQIQLQPYLALLAMTYPTGAVSEECVYDPIHLKYSH